ncbi:MAG: hypothetical protein RDV41_06140 [Planctomycetota bacterium]|nr:hypothetical protein [Planctomycetota bacterium]
MPTRKDYIRLAIGKVRRQVQFRLQPGKVAESMGKRVGECKRCSACCRLPVRCLWLIDGVNGSDAKCRWYTLRPTVCRLFPITQSDIEDRNAINPKTPCGYHFEERSNGRAHI